MMDTYDTPREYEGALGRLIEQVRTVASRNCDLDRRVPRWCWESGTPFDEWCWPCVFAKYVEQYDVERHRIRERAGLNCRTPVCADCGHALEDHDPTGMPCHACGPVGCRKFVPSSLPVPSRV